MNGKNVVATLAITVAVFANDAFAQDRRQPMTQEEKAARTERFRMKTGGTIYDRREASGSCVFVNAQTNVHQEVIKLQATRLERDVLFNIEVRDAADITFATAASVFKAMNANAAVFVVDNQELPSLTVVPEGKWAIVNVGALGSGVDAVVLAQRTAKEMSRALAFVFGAGYPITNVGPFIPVFDPEGLDGLLMQTLPMEVSNQVQMNAEKKFGIKCFKRSFYAKAYEEGWAPAPVNKYQESAKRRVDYKRAYMAGKNEPPTEDWQRDVIQWVDSQAKQLPDKPLQLKHNPAAK